MKTILDHLRLYGEIDAMASGIVLKMTDAKVYDIYEFFSFKNSAIVSFSRGTCLIYIISGDGNVCAERLSSLHLQYVDPSNFKAFWKLSVAAEEDLLEFIRTLFFIFFVSP